MKRKEKKKNKYKLIFFFSFFQKEQTEKKKDRWQVIGTFPSTEWWFKQVPETLWTLPLKGKRVSLFYGLFFADNGVIQWLCTNYFWAAHFLKLHGPQLWVYLTQLAEKLAVSYFTNC